MATGADWSREEVEACVADYLQMLTLQLNGQRYSKTAHAEALMARLDGRSRGSVEFKHCNISAAMLALGYPYLEGYKPRSNFQALLLQVVAEQASANAAVQAAAEAAALRPAVAAATTDIETIWESAPRLLRVREAAAPYAPLFTPAHRDYLALEARNRSLGSAGETFVVELEARRLHLAGKKALSDRVEHVSASQGDGLGYDVLSFEADGREKLIEVKTTAFGKLTPFYVSRNEVARSSQDAERYHLYRLFDFRGRPRLFDLPGMIENHCRLDPVSYLARLGD